MSLLTANHLSYHAHDRPLLNKVNFTLHHGQKVALLGRSGSGKSVLLQALADLLSLDSDENNRIMLNKTPLSQIPPHAYRTQVALFHQMPELGSGTVRDNLTMPFGFKHHQGKTFDEAWHIDKLHQLGKSADFLTQSVATLSGGERQLVSFLRTLQFDPLVALFDEPTSALDVETAHALMTLVLDWHDEHKAFIWVTHHPDEPEHLGAQRWYMNQGRLSCQH